MCVLTLRDYFSFFYDRSCLAPQILRNESTMAGGVLLFDRPGPSGVNRQAGEYPVFQNIAKLINRPHLAPADREVSELDARTGRFPAVVSTSRTHEQSCEYQCLTNLMLSFYFLDWPIPASPYRTAIDSVPALTSSISRTTVNDPVSQSICEYCYNPNSLSYPIIHHLILSSPSGSSQHRLIGNSRPKTRPSAEYYQGFPHLSEGGNCPNQKEVLHPFSCRPPPQSTS
jgi:hypothetical protein